MKLQCFSPYHLAYALGVLLFIFWAFFSTDDSHLPALPFVKLETHTPLNALCKQTLWTEGLWLQCHSGAGENGTSAQGGLNNARNRVQTCIRLAIDAGSGLIIPPIACNRSRSDNMDLSTSVCADEFWNMEQLEEGLHKQCPQLQLRFCGDIGGIDTTLHLPHVEYHGAALQPGDLNASIAASLSEAQISEVSETSPVVIFFADPYTGFNYSARGETATVRKDLFKVLNFNEHLLSISGLLSQDHRLSHGYIGVHFRAEPDWPYDFGTAEEQLQHYLEYLETIRTTSPEMTTIYISCGFEEAVEHFREKVAPLGFTVIDKWLLLQEHPAMLEEVNSMNFDQQAIVEYSLMVGADYFTGNMVSTLSMVIAYARTMDEEPEFFPSYILDGSHREPPKRRYWDVAPAMHGHNTTRLMVVNLGVGANIDFYDTLP